MSMKKIVDVALAIAGMVLWGWLAWLAAGEATRPQLSGEGDLNAAEMEAAGIDWHPGEPWPVK